MTLIYLPPPTLPLPFRVVGFSACRLLPSPLLLPAESSLTPRPGVLVSPPPDGRAPPAAGGGVEGLAAVPSRLAIARSLSKKGKESLLMQAAGNYAADYFGILNQGSVSDRHPVESATRRARRRND